MKSAAEEGTRKLYLDDFSLTRCEAEVLEVEGPSSEATLTLDQTCFYPGGGGQPCDLGAITWSTGSMQVTKVRKEPDGVVRHVGVVEGLIPYIGDSVTCIIDAPLRHYYSRLHSAGHLLDLAVERAGNTWVPGRGAHFPDMSYVEYNGDFDATKADVYREAIQEQIDSIIAAGGQVTSSRVRPQEARKRSKYIPEAVLAKYKLVHLATYNGSFDICCGGTHVQNVADIGKVIVTKIKKKEKAIRVSYSL